MLVGDDGEYNATPLRASGWVMLSCAHNEQLHSFWYKTYLRNPEDKVWLSPHLNYTVSTS